jgi:hypothetical protein
VLKRTALIAGCSLAVAAVPALAAKPTHPSHPAHPSHPVKPTKPSHPAKPGHPAHPTHPSHPSHGKKGQSGTCTPGNRGYRASGTLVSATLTPSTKKGHYDGTISLDIKRANHKSSTGTQTFTLTNSRVHFGKGVDSSAPAAGDNVVVHGKITALRHGCSATGFTPAVTVRSVRISAPKRHP